MEYADLVYAVADQLPKSEEFNLKSQMIRAATSISLNIAEGSTGQTDPEQARFLGLAIRSLVETVACQRLIERRYPELANALAPTEHHVELLAAKLHTFRKAISPGQHWLREESSGYQPGDSDPEEERS